MGWGQGGLDPAVDRCWPLPTVARWRMLRWTRRKGCEVNLNPGDMQIVHLLFQRQCWLQQIGEGGPVLPNLKFSKCGFLIYKLLVLNNHIKKTTDVSRD